MFFVSFFYVFHGRQELFLVFFVVFHGRKEVIVKKSFVFHGRRTFFLHFFYFFHGRKCFSLKYPSSSMEDELFFHIFYLLPWKTSVLFFVLLSSPVGDECFFLFSANPMLQRRSFSSIGLISNAHRAERSTNFLIMKSASMVRRPRETLNFATPRLEFYKYYSECCT